MRHMRKLLALALAVMLVMSLATSAFAANDTAHTIKIDNAVSGYTYEAYQIFKGDLVNGQLTNIAWGDNIDSTKLEDLMADLNAIEAFADCDTVVQVAAVLGNISTEDHATTMAFADVVGKYLKTPAAGTSSYAEGVYTIPVTGDGYYLVKNTAVPENADDTSYTRYILKVVADVTVKHKGTVPSVEKKIVTESGKADANTADIGDSVNYEITGTLPSNIGDYDSYYYVFTDTLSKGLYYNGDVKVTVNGVDVTDYFYKNATAYDATNGTTITVGIQDILSLELLENPDVGEITADTKIVVTYSATLNENAVIGTNGNPNEVELDYSNDPNNDGEGATLPPPPNPEKPVPSTPTGETPKDTVITFSTKIELTKVDSLTKETLTGAKFQISGVSSKVVVVNKEMYVEAENGEYYRLKDGTYTKTAPVLEDDESTTDKDERTADSYDDTSKKYNKVTVVNKETVAQDFVAEGWVNEAGVITFTGLGEGTYTIEEIVAPTGYNLLTAPITVVITSDASEITDPTVDTTVIWTAKDGTGEGAKNWTVTNGIVEITVENTSGATLPETGGIGTTIFYILGGVLVLAAVVLLVTKKRMSV